MMNLFTNPVGWRRDRFPEPAEPIAFQVFLSPTEEVLLANIGPSDREEWQVLRTRDGVAADWAGSYASADEAMTALGS